nr:hypothetical protein [Allomuricauda sp.]
MRKYILIILVFSAFIAAPTEIEAQILKKAWKKVKKGVNDGIDELTKGKDEKNSSKSSETSKKQNESNEPDISSLNIDFEPGQSFKSSNKEFKPIEIQKHNGLLRFGAVNSYGKYTSNKYAYDKAMTAKIESYVNAQQLYFLMVETKNLKKYLENLETDVLYESLTSRSRYNDPTAWQNRDLQVFLQRHVKTVAFRILGQRALEKYFSNPDSPNPKPQKFWGGHSSDEFRKMEKYQAFCETDLKSLMNWSSDFMKGDELEFYFVTPLSIKEYNFEKKAFETSNTKNGLDNIYFQTKFTGDKQQPFGEYVPENDFEYNPNPDAKGKYSPLDIPMSVTEAKKFEDRLSKYGTFGNQKVVYIIRKIKWKKARERRTLASKNEEPVYKETKYTYSFSEPFVTVYEDEALTKKVADIQMFLN